MNIYNLLSTKTVVGKDKIRIGRNFDGGYVVLNDFQNSKIVYNIGIDGTYSFDEEIIIANPKIDVFKYDHTIEGIKNNSTKLHWKKNRIKRGIRKKRRIFFNYERDDTFKWSYK